MDLFTILLLVICGVMSYLYIIEKNKNIEHKSFNDKIDKENEQLELKNSILKKEIQDKEDMLNQADSVARQAFSAYCDVLENNYQEKEQEYAESAALLAQSYENKQAEILAEIDLCKKDLDKIRATQAAAIQARIREQEIQKNITFYTLELSDIDKREIHILQSIETELRDPRPIRMAI